jgi:CrcB protein
MKGIAMLRYLVILLGAGLGGVARFFIGTTIMSRFRGGFPLGTFLVNVSGCFLTGLLMTILTERFPAHINWRLFLVVGVLGGYTTFSSFEFENLMAARTGDWFIALANAVGSVVAGFIAAWLGLVLATRR